MRSILKTCALLCVATCASSLAHAGGGRTQLRAVALDSAAVKGPVDMTAFARPASAAPAHQVFEGRLKLDKPKFDGGFQVIWNKPYDIPITVAVKTLPPFDFAFVQDGDTLIPARRGAIASANPAWEVILEPGQVWEEASDGGATRASLPFTLREVGANCMHNGVLSFVFTGNTISRVYYQISSESCAYFKFNAWGSAAAHYTPAPLPDADKIKTAYRAEVASRLSVKPLSAFSTMHPGVSAPAFALAPPPRGDLPVLYGVVLDGVNYTGNCGTRAGPYPYCDVLDLPSYSTAKTVLAAIGLMRLEKLWPGARTALIADYVPECATADWTGVTFENLLNMTSGVYGNPGFEIDENSEATRAFFNTDTHKGKIAFACRHDHRRSPAGHVWVYRTTDTYVLGTAMQEFVRRHLGESADLYRDIHVAQLWHRLHLSPVMDSTLRTYDMVQQPLAGYGLTYHRDDIARIAAFLSLSSGAINGDQLLDKIMLSRALQRDPTHRGMDTGYQNFKYAYGIWARDIAPALGCGSETWVPFMSGYGGISVVMLPNGAIYYYFGDSGIWDWSPAAIELNKIRSICR